MEIPALTTGQMIEVDRLMIEDYGIQLFQMMENAGRNLADLTGQILGVSLSGRSICVLCGRGNNGGGGMVAARHLLNRGAKVHTIRLSGELKDIPAMQWRILKRMGLRNEINYDLSKSDMIIDALIGYGLRGELHSPVVEQIKEINISGRPILALDAPSGLNTDLGNSGRLTVKANATMTLALPKLGLMNEAARPFVGSLYLADISVPPALYRRLGLEVGNIFSENPIIKLWE
jgi:NAD(P)H-hydrate epimerase